TVSVGLLAQPDLAKAVLAGVRIRGVPLDVGPHRLEAIEGYQEYPWQLFSESLHRDPIGFLALLYRSDFQAFGEQFVDLWVTEPAVVVGTLTGEEWGEGTIRVNKIRTPPTDRVHLEVP